MVGEAVAHEAQATLFNVLLNRVERLLLGDFHLCIGPARNLNNHVKDSIILVGKERDVVERRDNSAILLDEDAVVYRVALHLVSTLY